MSSRDSQKGRVYAAERSLGWWDGPEHFARFSDLTKFALKVTRSKRVEKMFPTLRRAGSIQIIERHHGRGACAGVDGMTFRPGSWRQWLVLHEMAHLLHKREYCYTNVREDPLQSRKGYSAAHGWRYCQIYLKLVLWFLGREEHDKLKAAFKVHRVRYKTPRKMSPEQRAAAVIRLAKMRPNANYFRAAA